MALLRTIRPPVIFLVTMIAQGTIIVPAAVAAGANTAPAMVAAVVDPALLVVAVRKGNRIHALRAVLHPRAALLPGRLAKTPLHPAGGLCQSVQMHLL